jgi:flagellar motility protein MotE (MotC chaperone)
MKLQLECYLKDYKMDNILHITERLRALEVKEEELRKQSDEHNAIIKELENSIMGIVSEMKQIRNALYLMAFTIACNVPVVSDLFTKIQMVMK